MREVLQGAHLVLLEWTAATNEQHGAFGTESVRDTGDRVGCTGTGGDYGTANAGDACRGVSGVRRHLLMAHVDDFHALVERTVVDIDDVTTGDGEDVLHALLLEHLGHNLTAADQLRRRGWRWPGHR